jgi:hypothetical protein
MFVCVLPRCKANQMDSKNVDNFQARYGMHAERIGIGIRGPGFRIPGSGFRGLGSGFGVSG